MVLSSPSWSCAEGERLQRHARWNVLQIQSDFFQNRFLFKRCFLNGALISPELMFSDVRPAGLTFPYRWVDICVCRPSRCWRKQPVSGRKQQGTLHWLRGDSPPGTLAGGRCQNVAPDRHGSKCCAIQNTKLHGVC